LVDSISDEFPYKAHVLKDMANDVMDGVELDAIKLRYIERNKNIAIFQV
jgi:hypothetical protein